MQKYTGKELALLYDMACNENCPKTQIEDMFFNKKRWRGTAGFRAHLENLAKGINLNKTYLLCMGNVITTYYKLIYEAPIDEMPLVINEDNFRAVIACWRLKIGK
jgi:hypothetical protein